MKIAHETVDDTEVYWLDFSAEIARGCKLLDRKFPGWVDRIDERFLDLRNVHSCVLGQIFVDEFVNGLVREYGFHYAGALRYLWGRDDDKSVHQAYRHGFNVQMPAADDERVIVLYREIESFGSGRDWAWDCLGTQWLDAIHARREGSES